MEQTADKAERNQARKGEQEQKQPAIKTMRQEQTRERRARIVFFLGVQHYSNAIGQPNNNMLLAVVLTRFDSEKGLWKKEERKKMRMFWYVDSEEGAEELRHRQEEEFARGQEEYLRREGKR